VFVLQVLGAGVAYAQQVLLARVLGVSHYGTYTCLYLCASLGGLLAGLGLPAASVRFLPAYRAAGEEQRARAFVATATRLTYSTALAALLVAAAVICSLSAVGVLADPYPFLLAALLFPTLAGSALETEIARAEHRMTLAYLAPLILRPALIGLGVALVAARATPSVAGALAVSALVAAGVLATQHRLAMSSRASLPRASSSSQERRGWVDVGLSLLAVSALVVVLMQLDILIVGAICGGHAAGVYSAASKTATLVSFVILAVNAPAAAQFAALWHEGRIEELRRLVTRLSSLIFWPSLSIAGALAVLAIPVLDLFGRGFSEARVVLLILLAGQLINACAGSVGYLLTLTGHHREAARALGVSALAFLALSAAGTAVAGLDGAAAGSTLGFLIWNVALGRLVVQKLRIWPSFLPAPRALGRLCGV